ncbi:MAG: TaqI-like C-terminal specificity domain-containing protein, partial [Anaerolineaceae bacterium]
LKDQNPEDQKNHPLRVLDPACGSGSFLLGAYQYLLDWYLDWYIHNDPGRWAKGKDPAVVEGQGGWQLTMDKKKEILLSHIYGVDIDAQAVEVTKLSLLLRVVESPGQLSWLNERILPDLGENIQCGNSLIGPDYYEDRQMPIFGDEEFYRVNVFDWHKAFPQVFAAGGFDAVIGNPPYVRQEMLGTQKKYFQQHYQVYNSVADLYSYFIEKGVSLLRDGGMFSYIVANKWMRTNYGQPLRSWLKTQKIKEIVDFGDLPVFEDATTYTCILRIKGGGKPGSIFTMAQVNTLNFSNLDAYIQEHSIPIRQERLEDRGWALVNEQTSDLIEKLRQRGVSLGQYVDEKVFYGIKTGLNEAFVLDAATRERLIAEDESSSELIKPFLAGRDVKRYVKPTSDRFLILIPRGWTREKSKGTKDAWKWLQQQYPAIAHHLSPFAEAGEKRYDKGEFWWELRACDYYLEFEKPKIIYPNICKNPEFTLDHSGLYTNQKCFIISTEDKYLLGIMNSALIFFLFRNILPKLRGDFFEPSYVFLKNFPIKTINYANQQDQNRHDRMVALVEGMLALHRQAAAARLSQDKEMIQRQIESTDAQIDRLVYDLYGLSGEEIKIVEGG